MPFNSLDLNHAYMTPSSIVYVVCIPVIMLSK